MKISIFLTVLVVFSFNSFANCKNEAKNIAKEAVKIFTVNEYDARCTTAGKLKNLNALPVILIWPPRYAYEAIFYFPCGPQPKNPKVTMMLNQFCEIVDLQVTGHKF